MVEIVGANGNVMHLEDFFADRRKVQLRSKLVQLDGKVRVCHLAGEGLFEVVLTLCRTINNPFVVRAEGGLEEREPLNVVPVSMSQQHMPTNRTIPSFHQVFAEEAGPGSTVEHEKRAVVSFEQHARRIPPIAHRVDSGRSNRAAGSPKLNVHGSKYTGTWSA